MSTAISRIYTPEGFVVAADRRRLHVESGEANDTVQKIFYVKQPGRHLAYALAGTTGITREGNNTDVLFDFVCETTEAVDTLAGVRAKNLEQYARLMQEALLPSLTQAKSVSGEVPEPTLIFLDGYYNGRPERAHIQFFPDDSDPQVSPDGLYPGRSIGHGSERVLELVYDNDPRFAAFAIPYRSLDSVGLSDAIDIAKRDIEVQCSPEALLIDEKICRAIGGRPLIATVTPTGGFQWVPGFELS